MPSPFTLNLMRRWLYCPVSKVKIIHIPNQVRKVLVTTTLIVVLFTTIVLGGGTLPLVKYLVCKNWRTFKYSRPQFHKNVLFRKVEVVQGTEGGAGKRTSHCQKPRSLAPWTVNICQV